MASLAEDKTTLPDAASILALIESVEKKEDYELASAFRKKDEEQPGVGWSLLSQISLSISRRESWSRSGRWSK
jgi:hypothetical protein